MVRTLENSVVGEGLRNQREDFDGDEEVVVFDDKNISSAPFTADDGFNNIPRPEMSGEFD